MTDTNLLMRTWTFKRIDSTLIENVQWCPTAQHYVSPRQRFFCYQICGFLLRRKDDNEVLRTLHIEIQRESLCGKSRLIAEKSMSPFLSPGLMSLVPQQPASSVKCSERDTRDCKLDFRDKVIVTYVALFWGSVYPNFMFMNNNVKPHRAHIVDDFLKEDYTRHMNCPCDCLTSVLLYMFGIV